MKPFERASIPRSEVRHVVNDLVNKWKSGDPAIRALFPTVKESTAARVIEQQVMEQQDLSADSVFLNDQYQVSLRDMGKMVHLSIKRLDRRQIKEWRDLQEIKNLLVGEECEAVELYPAESRKVDTSCQYHLWCVVDPNYRFPFGFVGARIVSDMPVGKSYNNPISDEDKIRNQKGGPVPISHRDSGT